MGLLGAILGKTLVIAVAGGPIGAGIALSHAATAANTAALV